jgi:hypothetical protein
MATPASGATVAVIGAGLGGCALVAGMGFSGYRNQWTPTPRSMAHRYVTEDVPCGLVPMSALGDAVGVATLVIDGLIALSSATLGRDLAREGRNLEHLGLAGLTAGEVRRVFELGPTL